MVAPEAAGWLAVAFVTFLGDPLVIGGIGVALYWTSPAAPRDGERLDRSRATLLLGTIVGALALTAALKTALAVERPAEAASLPGIDGLSPALAAVYTWVVGPGGYAFPSGHAVSATVGWGGLALSIADTDRRPHLLAGAAIVAIAASRVALGVHRPLEVTVGIAVGLLYLFVAFELLGTPRRTLALAGVIGIGSLTLVELDTDGLYTAGAALGGALGWALLEECERTRLGLLGALLLVVWTLVALRWGVGQLSLLTAGVAGGLAVIVAPVALDRDAITFEEP